jgi:DNA repair protein RadC
VTKLPIINYITQATGAPVSKRALRNTRHAAEYALGLIPDDGREYFIVLLLNGLGHVLGLHTVAIGTVDTVSSMPSEVYRAALLTPGCSAIIAVHNHPSGVVGLTKTDRRAAVALKKAGKILGVELFDYLVIVHRAVGIGKFDFAAYKGEDK